ncbi:unnamed protein product [Penicillium roqueforti FM164]|uniref:Uncharacterized protein n=1 Tax=Penicillium roqueforti (strain FM164) TaxID=1365484 RepID=W6QPH8_PENRF|nr:unnamed protein product [Penicillium roqueforti FM164]
MFVGNRIDRHALEKTTDKLEDKSKQDKSVRISEMSLEDRKIASKNGWGSHWPVNSISTSSGPENFLKRGKYGASPTVEGNGQGGADFVLTSQMLLHDLAERVWITLDKAKKVKVPKENAHQR